MNEAQLRLKAKFKKKPRYVDYALIFIVFFMLAFGLVMLYSTSSYEAAMQLGDSMYYLKHQAVSMALGVGLMIVISFLPYHFYKRLAPGLYIFAAAFIVAVIPFGYTANGAKRWIRIFGISVQPAEVAKVAIIIFTATIIVNVGRKINAKKGVLKILMFAIIYAALIYAITKNLSSAIIVVGISFVMLFVATPGYRRYILFLLLVTVLAVVGVYAITKIPDSTGMNFRFARILAWLDPEAYASGKGYQTLQSLYAIGSGGIFGKGLGESMQKMGFIPEAQNDMIFSIICEELGLFGGIAVVLMFILLIWRMVIIASNAPDMFGSLLVVGVMAHISIQVILNIAVVTNVLPNTGITLPFISYGGSAVLLQLVEIGIVLSVARSIEV